MEQVCADRDRAFRRINVEILGNRDPVLHAHIWPRYEWEPPELVGLPVWLYPPGRWRDPATALGPAHDGLRAALMTAVGDLAADTAFNNIVGVRTQDEPSRSPS